VAFAPSGFASFAKAMPLWLNQKLRLPRVMRKALQDQYRKRFIFSEHHESHAASSFFPSPFEEAAILTLDGVGEWATASIGVGQGNKMRIAQELMFPHSLGLLYSAFTYYCGFRVNSGEYKLMGLAPYGEPTYVDQVMKLLDLRDDGSFRLDMSYFNYCQGLTMTSQKFHDLFGGPPRNPESKIDGRFMDIAASIQKVTEEIMLRCCRHAHRITGMKNLCLAGGVALNCVGNGKLLREGPFERIWIQPAAGDAGGALGVALLIWYQLLDNPRTSSPLDLQHGSLLGPQFSNQEIQRFLDSQNARYHYYRQESELCDRVADLMIQGKVVGWVQGRMEFGPRALGCRSIIGDARSEQMQYQMNVKIKFRESFRPFAPCVLKERAHEFFEMRPEDESPYMLLVAPVREDKRCKLDGQTNGLTGIDKLKVRRSLIPAVTHVDYSARVQTVDAERHGRFYRLMKAFERKTDCPVIINTSFNIRGEPIVCSAQDAHRCFLATNMDALVVEDFLLLKEEQPNARQVDVDSYLKQFSLD
jgi:carbamoyltransferase